MKYLLDYQFNILCSDNFLIPRLNKKYDYISNTLSEYKITEQIPINDYCEITKEDVEAIRSAYFSKTSSMLSLKNMQWIENFDLLINDLDYSDKEHIKMYFYYIYLHLRLLKFTEKFCDMFTKNAMNHCNNLSSEEKQNFINSIIEPINTMIQQKKYWYIDDLDKCNREIEFLSKVIDKIKNNEELDYDTIEAEYLTLSKDGIVFFNYIVNKTKDKFTKGLSLEEQRGNLITVNRILTTKIGNELLKRFKLNSNETRIFKSLYGRLERVLLINMETWN